MGSYAPFRTGDKQARGLAAPPRKVRVGHQGEQRSTVLSSRHFFSHPSSLCAVGSRLASSTITIILIRRPGASTAYV